MAFSAGFLLINLAYVINVVALAVRDVVWLRLLLLPGQASFLAWGVVEDNLPTIFWNLLFMAINGTQLTRELLDRRPMPVPPELEDLHRAAFPDMRPRDFLTFWRLGDDVERRDGFIVHEGEQPQALLLVEEGDVEVRKDGQRLGVVPRGGFVAEMSFLSGNPASADVIAHGTVRMRAWTHSQLRALEKLNPDLYIRIQAALGRDITRKMTDAHRSYLGDGPVFGDEASAAGKEPS